MFLLIIINENFSYIINIINSACCYLNINYIIKYKKCILIMCKYPRFIKFDSIDFNWLLIVSIRIKD